MPDMIPIGIVLQIACPMGLQQRFKPGGERRRRLKLYRVRSLIRNGKRNSPGRIFQAQTKDERAMDTFSHHVWR